MKNKTELAKSNPHGVAVGQVWRSTDPRSSYVQVQVEEVAGAFAVVKGVGENGSKSRRRIRLDRFRKSSTGYELVGGQGEAPIEKQHGR